MVESCWAFRDSPSPASRVGLPKHNSGVAQDIYTRNRSWNKINLKIPRTFFKLGSQVWLIPKGSGPFLVNKPTFSQVLIKPYPQQSRHCGLHAWKIWSLKESPPGFVVRHPRNRFDWKIDWFELNWKPEIRQRIRSHVTRGEGFYGTPLARCEIGLY